MDLRWLISIFADALMYAKIIILYEIALFTDYGCIALIYTYYSLFV